jgi:hypothetical protein
MQEASRIVAMHGSASVDIIRQRIEKALADGEDAEALRLDNVLQQVEWLINAAPQQCAPDDRPESSDA